MMLRRRSRCFRLPTEEGRPLLSQDRPQFYYDGHDWDAVHYYPDVESVHPGESARAYLAFLSPAEHVGRLRPGRVFLLRQGNRVIGYGSVVRLLDLNKSATSRNRK